MADSQSRWGQLDQVRAIAAFLVFSWHFVHGAEGYPVSFHGAPRLPLAALFDEGHVGVALFMCLSGYLFSRILDGKTIKYRQFIGARMIRLMPLFAFAMLVFLIGRAIHGTLTIAYVGQLMTGFLLPIWPNGGWSIAVELHFYLILPFVLAMRRHHKLALPLFLALMIAFRVILYEVTGSIQHLAYWTIVGRIDQFLLGILCYDCRRVFTGRHGVAVANIAVFAFGYWLFDRAGGFYELAGTYPTSSPLWILMPTFEAICCSMFIAWYDTSFSFDGPMARALETIGFYSYGIYLLHFFVVFKMAAKIAQIFPLDDFYVAWAWSLPCFLIMLAPSWLAYRFIELPFQRFKPQYAT